MNTKTNQTETVNIAGTEYTVTIPDLALDYRSAILTGPRGAEYFLRPFRGEDTGLRQVISYNSGQPLRKRGNEIRVYHIGNIIEVAN